MHQQRDKLQQTKTAEPEDKEVKNQTNKLEREENITYIAENTKRSNQKDSTEDGKKTIRVKNFEERIEDKMAVEMGNIQTKAKPQENDEVVNEVSNNHKKTSFGIGQRKEKAEEPKYNDRNVEVKRTQPSNYYENKTENHQNIKKENCMTCGKYITTRVQFGQCQKWLRFKCEETTKDK